MPVVIMHTMQTIVKWYVRMPAFGVMKIWMKNIVIYMVLSPGDIVPPVMVHTPWIPNIYSSVQSGISVFLVIILRMLTGMKNIGKLVKTNAPNVIIRTVRKTGL